MTEARPAIAVPPSLAEPWSEIAEASGLRSVVVAASDARRDGPELVGVSALLAGELPRPELDPLVAALPDLAWVHVTSAGVDWLPLAAWHERGITVTNSRGCYDIPIAEHCLGLMLSHARRFVELGRFQASRSWRKDLPVRTLAHDTVGIVGLGSIGREVARLAKACRMRVEAVRRRPRGKRPDHVDRLHRPQDLCRLLKAADHVVVCTPLTAETRDLIGENELQHVRPGASLINVARGGVLDEQALLRGLEVGRPGTAYLDVFREEPLPRDHPFWSHERVVVTPHLSGQAPQLERWLTKLFRENCERWSRAGGRVTAAKLVNRVDARAGY